MVPGVFWSEGGEAGVFAILSQLVAEPAAETTVRRRLQGDAMGIGVIWVGKIESGRACEVSKSHEYEGELAQGCGQMGGARVVGDDEFRGFDGGNQFLQRTFPAEIHDFSATIYGGRYLVANWTFLLDAEDEGF